MSNNNDRMGLTRRQAVAGALVGAAASLAPRASRAQGKPALRIGVVNDQSGAYATGGGPGSVACVREAVREFAAPLGLDVEVLSADHQGKPDIALAICRKWFDEGVDAAMDFQNSAVALACTKLARERDKVALVCNAGTSDLTGPACSPNTLHWAWDTQMLARVSGNYQVKKGNDSWFFITADYSFGHSLEADATAVIKAAGGRVVGSVKMPFPTEDFSSAILQAMSSDAKVIAMANAGDDAVTSVKQAAEFGVTKSGKVLVPMLLHLNDVHALGLQAAQGLTIPEVFYWDLNERTRAFANRVQPHMVNQFMPNMGQAACYAAAAHYIKTAAAMGVAEAKKSGAAAVARMKAAETDDAAYGRCKIREDGRVMHTAYLMKIKSPSESKRPFDYYTVLDSVPPEQAWRPMSEDNCPMVNKG